MKPPIRVFKHTINPGHGRADSQQKSNNKSDYDVNFKLHQLISVEQKQPLIDTKL